MPSTEKVAVVSSDAGSAKVTVPGPLVIAQLVVTIPGGSGRPSSDTVPSRSTSLSGRVIVGVRVEALTVGGWFSGGPTVG